MAVDTPVHWQLSYWDENLSQGRRSTRFPRSSVHPRFARRAHELAAEIVDGLSEIVGD